MFRFFRTIRQKLFLEGRVSKYLGYALGEIVLIVVGILIAVQINGWNQNRADREKEALLLIEIHNEFLRNKDELERSLSGHMNRKERHESLIQLFPIDHASIDREKVSDLFFRANANPTTDLTMASISNVVNSASIEIISNEELRSAIMEWHEQMSDFQERETRLNDWSVQFFIPYLSQRIPIPYEMGIRDNRVDLSFMSSIEFENLIKRRVELLATLERAAHGEGSWMVQAVNRIIELSKPPD